MHSNTSVKSFSLTAKSRLHIFSFVALRAMLRTTQVSDCQSRYTVRCIFALFCHSMLFMRFEDTATKDFIEQDVAETAEIRRIIASWFIGSHIIENNSP